jgi:hypothetical protein
MYAMGREREREKLKLQWWYCGDRFVFGRHVFLLDGAQRMSGQRWRILQEQHSNDDSRQQQKKKTRAMTYGTKLSKRGDGGRHWRALRLHAGQQCQRAAPKLLRARHRQSRCYGNVCRRRCLYRLAYCFDSIKSTNAICINNTLH